MYVDAAYASIKIGVISKTCSLLRDYVPSTKSKKKSIFRQLHTLLLRLFQTALKNNFEVSKAFDSTTTNKNRFFNEKWDEIFKIGSRNISERLNQSG